MEAHASSKVGSSGGGVSSLRRRRAPTSPAERERRKAFGEKYGQIMRQIKLDRERSAD